MQHLNGFLLWIVGFLFLIPSARAQDGRIVIPHHQKEPPGPALTPEQAVAKMTVPDGFAVELVASEPDIVNPVAMTIDERGRFWITESFEYPRRSAGPGRDRVKILEDTNQDGTIDKVTVFAEGLNIPSGIAVGHGGVWVANSPDILFLQDTDGDGRADRQEVVVSGFGRTDTHELPNSLTWGPDGWLYGLNGVFNHSQVRHRGREFNFTCAMFRIHPVTREFELFAEGTSNPWGIAFDLEGSAFISACVIDHLWHITESGYYHRQGGPYPAHTWKLGSIVKHKHQMAAYCGITFFDSDAYPPHYREKLYMGNIHGGCINVDYLERRGATYFAKPDPDFLTANDVWFMPVVQKTGPDGCLYILDWYDRYHCYQDANRDPEGIDRGRGRLYRVRYRETPRAAKFNLADESNEQLIDRLFSPNVYYRDIAQRLLIERHDSQANAKLRELVLRNQTPHKARMHALWSLVGQGDLDRSFHESLLDSPHPSLRAWGVRAARNMGEVHATIVQRIRDLAADEAPEVRLQVAIAATKIQGLDPLPTLLAVLQESEDDLLIPHIVWQNLHPLLETQGAQFVNHVAAKFDESAPIDVILPRAVNRILDASNVPIDAVSQLVLGRLNGATAKDEATDECLSILWRRFVSSPPSDLEKQQWRSQLSEAAQQSEDVRLILLSALFDVESSQIALRRLITAVDTDSELRVNAFETLAAINDSSVIDAADRLLAEADRHDRDVTADVIASLGRISDSRVATVLLNRYSTLPDPLKPRAIDVLTQRIEWSKSLLQRIGQGHLPREVLHVNQARRLQGSAELAALVQKHWGTVRAGRNADVEKAIERVKELVEDHPGDPIRGIAVFKKSCAQCHQIYGEGENVGPDITRNGRASFDQLLSNVFDPNLVIGAGYQAHTVITASGRSLSGLLVEDSPQRVVLRLQGGKEEAIPRDQIDEFVVSPLSLMPEGWEKQITDQELVDLVAFLCLDGPPDHPQSRKIPGTP